jgi:hypothetical protein
VSGGIFATGRYAQAEPITSVIPGNGATRERGSLACVAADPLARATRADRTANKPPRLGCTVVDLVSGAGSNR